MKSWMRIIIAVFVLIGGAVSFRYWSLSQFDDALDSLSSSYVMMASPVPLSFHKEFDDPVSTSSEMISGSITSTSSSETPAIIATSTDPELSFTFPQKSERLYIGCNYQISWQSSNLVDSLDLALVDAGTREIIGPITGGLARENKIETNSQYLDWKVGIVWPGEYYIKVLKINGIEREIRSKVFSINKVSDDFGGNEQGDLCKKSVN